jgi:hypothetical protein
MNTGSSASLALRGDLSQFEAQVALGGFLAVESVDRRLNGRRDVLRGGDGLDLAECRAHERSC